MDMQEYNLFVKKNRKYIPSEYETEDIFERAQKYKL